jgi:hypothetical protein
MMGRLKRDQGRCSIASISRRPFRGIIRSGGLRKSWTFLGSSAPDQSMGVGAGRIGTALFSFGTSHIGPCRKRPPGRASPRASPCSDRACRRHQAWGPAEWPLRSRLAFLSGHALLRGDKDRDPTSGVEAHACILANAVLLFRVRNHLSNGPGASDPDIHPQRRQSNQEDLQHISEQRQAARYRARLCDCDRP